MKLIKACIALCLVLSLLLAGCAVTPQSTDTAPDAAAQTDSQAAQSQQSTQTDAAAVSTAAETGSELFSNRDLSGEYDETEAVAISLTGDSASCTGSGVAIDGSTVTITQAGTYILTGTLYGSVIVNAADTEKVQLVLRGAAIYSETFAAIYVAQADKVFVTLDAGTLSELSNDGTFEQIDENNVDAVIFSKEDLTINGTGELVINAPAGHGIVSKDDLVLTSGTVEIEAASQALSGKDSVCIAGGTYYLTAGKDAIHSENADDPAKGNVYIADGSFQLSADGDGISASGTLTIENVGNIDSQPYIRITQVTDTDLDITAGGVRFKLPGLGKGNTITINCEDRSEDKPRNISIGYDYPTFAPGYNIITVHAGTAGIEMRYKDRWI